MLEFMGCSKLQTNLEGTVFIECTSEFVLFVADDILRIGRRWTAGCRESRRRF